MAPRPPSEANLNPRQNSSTEIPASDFNDGFISTKKDKRQIKRSIIRSRIEKSATSKPSPKRRRPSKKLVATLTSLADALPDDDHSTPNNVQDQANIIRHKTVKTRPGAMKRKEKLERLERERFAKNMAQMAGKPTDPKGVSAANTGADNNILGRWAALRSFITETLERKEEFTQK